MSSWLAPTAFVDRTVVLIGGGSGVGLCVARAVVEAGGQVVLGGRTQQRIADAAADLGDSAQWRTVDTSDADSVSAFFGDIDIVHGVFTTAATYVTGPMRDLGEAEAATPFESKFWGQYRVVKAALPRLADDASIVLMSGAASVRPPGSAPAYIAANAAVEGLARGLAVELSPVRVNAVAPGTIDGNLWRTRDPDVRRAAFDQYVSAATIGRLITEDEVAQSVVHLLLNGAMTGSVVYPDGGYTFR